MNQREKILAAMVGALLAAMMLYFLFDSVSASFISRIDRITHWENEIAKKKNKVSGGQKADKQMKSFLAQSLPSDVDKAESLYSKWLYDLTDEIKFRDVDLSSTRLRTREKSFQQLQYTLTARGDLKQLTRFLYKFHSADHLHRFRSLRIRPVVRSKDLDLSITIYALSLEGADSEKTLSEKPGDRMADAELQPYLDSILGRNLFGPPNHAPQLASSSTQRIHNDRSLSYSPKAKDADKLDKLTWSLVDDKLPGAKIDAGSGQLRWSPEKNGTYQVTIRVADDGYPSKSADQTVTIVVSDPPPNSTRVDPGPKNPSFDLSKYTVLTTIFEVNGKRLICLHLRTTDQEESLVEGDPIEIGGVFYGVIQCIEKERVEIKIDGKSLWLNLGDALSEARSQPSERKSPGISLLPKSVDNTIPLRSN